MKPIVAFLAFVVGAAAGATVAVLVVRQKYIDLAEEEIQSVKDMYEARVQEAEDDEECMRAEFDEIQAKHAERVEAEKKKEYEKKVAKVGYRTNYSGISDSSDPAERLGPSEAAGAHVVGRGVSKKEPYVISIDDFHNTKNYFDKITLSYYDGDNTMIDDKEDLVEDVHALVGDNFVFGELSEDPDVVYIRNEKMTTDFEIARIKGSYSELIGMSSSDFKRGPNREGDDDEESDE